MKIAVLGLNHGFTLAQQAKKMAGLTLVAVAGSNSGAKERAKELDVLLYVDYKELVDTCNLDGVIITLPNHLHKEAVKYCADKGLHCLVEKPIADTTDAAWEMINYCRGKQVHLLVGHHRRYSAKINHLKHILDSKVIGDLISVNMIWALAKDHDYYKEAWRVKAGGGPLLINGIHDLDNLLYVTDLEIESVYAVGKNKIRSADVEDTVTAILEAEDGTVIHYFLTDGVPSPWSYEFNLRENPIYHFYDEDCYYFFGTKGSLAFPSFRCYQYSEEAYGWKHPLIEKKYLPVETVDPIAAELAHFEEVLKGGIAPRVPGEAGLKTLEVLEAINLSIREKRSVALQEIISK
ncbi:Gfo/Idh/MocA family protein [Terribacillus saccharophilus]|uniref:Gfo/Idh/MocA family protein n=1 Tax=Terribacillus saccharophilus TaxID=361277 RepID=UPI002DC80FF7|nr:Gfo/Idh/MocA family oxidoreductase [Terribacillus saccharophilus]MEC0288998.1 Gfo/Idh/MocA family oxidoreductase [Terribacillus saccharophilus]